MRSRGWWCSLVLILAGLGIAARPARGQESLQAAYHAQLEAKLNDVAGHLHGVMGFAIKDLTTGETFFRLPDTVKIADKPGALEAVRCDSGIVEVAGHPLILTVMTTYLSDENAGERAIEKVARLAYAYFDRLSRSSPYGRVISEK